MKRVILCLYILAVSSLFSEENIRDQIQENLIEIENSIIGNLDFHERRRILRLFDETAELLNKMPSHNDIVTLEDINAMILQEKKALEAEKAEKWSELKKAIADESSSGWVSREEKDSEVNDSEESDSEVNDSEEKDSEESDSEEKDSEESDSEVNDSEKNDSEKNDSEENDSEENDSEENDSEENDSEENDSEENDSEESYLEENDSEKSDSEESDSEESDSEESDSEESDSEENDSEVNDSEENDSEVNDSEENDSGETDPQPALLTKEELNALRMQIIRTPEDSRKVEIIVEGVSGKSITARQLRALLIYIRSEEYKLKCIKSVFNTLSDPREMYTFRFKSPVIRQHFTVFLKFLKGENS